MKETSVTILVVDDVEQNRDVLARRLKRKGYGTIQAEGGREALALIETTEVDLVLLDLQMPGMDGREVLRHIRAKRSPSTLPVIIVTADCDRTSVIETLDLGANDYVTKPVDFEVALARIRSQLALREAERARRESEERYALATAGSNDGIWDWNMKTGNVFFSDRWKSMLGLPESGVRPVIDSWLSRIHPEDAARVESDLRNHFEGIDDHFESEHRILHRDGTYRWVLVRGLAVRDAAGKACRIAGSQSDITAGKVADPLTGLPNRVLFLDRLGRLTERAKRQPEHLFAVLFLDIDRFKLVNDSMGHVVGDQLLVAVARRLERCLRASDTVSRWGEGHTLARLGGDEFTILLDGLHNSADAVRVGERLCAALEQPFKIQDTDIYVSASIGVALSSSECHGPEEILNNADTAMYRAKSLGKSRVEVFDAEMRASAAARLMIETELRHAIERRELQNWYQLIVNLRSGEVRGLEALARWQHPARGIVNPDQFIGVAEETGMILPLGRQVLIEACRQIGIWQKLSPVDPPLIVSVNLSPRQFSEPALLAEIRDALDQTGVDPSSLKLEITEGMLIRDPAAARELLKELKAMGVRIGIDDFGTGYSSLSYLHSYPLDTLKVDRSFVSSMDDKPDQLEIVRTIISLAHNLGLDVIAEGVENERHLELLRSLGCEYGQGYFFSRPVDAAAATDLITAHRRWLPEGAAVLTPT